MARNFRSLRKEISEEHGDEDAKKAAKTTQAGVDAPTPSDEEELDDEPRGVAEVDAIKPVYTKRSDGSYSSEKIHEEVLEENVLDTLKKAAMKHQAAKTRLDDGSLVNVDVQSANAILKVYGALNTANQEKMARMLQSGKTNFSKVLDFSFSKMSGPGQAAQNDRVY